MAARAGIAIQLISAGSIVIMMAGAGSSVELG
jgi:hypothetical protein